MFTDVRPEGLEPPTDRILVSGPPVSIFSPCPHGWTPVDISRRPKSAVNTAVRSIADCAEELLPAIRRGEAISTDGTPMQDVQDMTGVAALVGRIEILEGTLGELLAELKSVYEDRDYWRTVAEGLSKTEVHIYGDPLMSDLINLA